MKLTDVITHFFTAESETIRKKSIMCWGTQKGAPTR